VIFSIPLSTFPYIPRSPAEKAGNHFITGKELHYKSLGHNPQFQLSIPLNLPVPKLRGWEGTLHSRAKIVNQVRFFNRKAIGLIFLTGFSARTS
jgi:hypothetical protein